MGVVVEAAEQAEALVERALAGMAERRVAEVVAERGGLGEILVEAERPGDGARHLRHFQGVGQAVAEVVALVEDEHLGLVGEPAERRRMDDAVAVAAEIAPRRARGFGVPAAAALRRIGRIGRWRGPWNRHSFRPKSR